MIRIRCSLCKHEFKVDAGRLELKHKAVKGGGTAMYRNAECPRCGSALCLPEEAIRQPRPCDNN